MAGEWWLGLLKPGTEVVLQLGPQEGVPVSRVFLCHDLLRSYEQPFYLTLIHGSFQQFCSSSAYCLHHIRNVIFSSHPCGSNLCGKLSSNRAFFIYIFF